MPAMKPLRVLLVSEGNWFLEKLFAADPSLRYEFLTPGAFRPEMMASFDAVVFDQCGPSDFASVSGNALFIRSGPLPFTMAGETPQVVENPVVAEADAEHPMMRLVEWSNVTLMRAARLAPPEAEGWSFTTPLRDAEIPLIVAGMRGREQRLAVFTFDIAETDLPLRVAFPLLMANTLQWLAGQEGAGAGDALCGELIPLQPGESVWSVSESPQAQAHAAGSFQPMRVGFYEIRGEGEGSRRIAVNAYSEAESDLRFTPSEEAQRPGTLAGLTAGRPLWLWLALAALALMAVEWSLYHRRITE